MEHKQHDTLTERHILLVQTCAGLSIKLEAALILLNGASCALAGEQGEQWQKMYA